MKRVLLITSLCGVGRAGMYPQILALARRGIQACPLPSVLLSTHTGGLGVPAKLPVGEQTAAVLEHYLKLGIKFDALISGYLPQPSLAEAIAEFVRRGGTELYVCDPVMADGGGFYGGMGEEQAAAYRRLVGLADVTTPNTTEAAILLGRDPSAHSDGAELAHRLLEICPRVVITGGGDGMVVYGEECSVGEFAPTRYPGRFIGTGDMFAAELTAALLSGAELGRAAEEASDAVSRCCAANLKSEDFRLGMEIEGR